VGWKGIFVSGCSSIFTFSGQSSCLVSQNVLSFSGRYELKTVAAGGRQFGTINFYG
jgi:hypothetical protein